MRLGCNALYPYGNLAHSALFSVEAAKEALRRLREASYDSVEFSHACHFLLEEAAAVGQYAASLGLECWSIHAEGPAGFSLGATVEESRAALLRGVQICGVTGARVLVVHAPTGIGLRLPTEVSLQEAMARDWQVLEPALAKAQQIGVSIALENGAALAHMEYILEVCETLATPSLGICVDTGHANLGDLGAPLAVRMAGDRLYTTHLHDNLGQVDDHLPPGRGTVPWDQVFAALTEIGYRRTLMLELTDMASHRDYDQQAEMIQGALNTRRMALGSLIPR
jgi:sugar phosphate isomerase/epimerase